MPRLSGQQLSKVWSISSTEYFDEIWPKLLSSVCIRSCLRHGSVVRWLRLRGCQSSLPGKIHLTAMALYKFTFYVYPHTTTAKKSSICSIDLVILIRWILKTRLIALYIAHTSAPVSRGCSSSSHWNLFQLSDAMESLHYYKSFVADVQLGAENRTDSQLPSFCEVGLPIGCRHNILYIP